MATAAYVTKACPLSYCTDTGPAHMTTTVHTPVIGLYA
ncbi:glycosyltransferase family 9 protein [Alteromonas sp. ALT199]